MFIDLTEIDREQFKVSERSCEGIGKVVLITPSFEKHFWNNEERHLRSLLCSPDGRILSAGFQKFHNYNEVPELDGLTEQAILSGNVRFTEKADGSLLIRSVINGQVHFRTRGSHTMGEEFETPIMNLIRERYPRLLDPSLDTRYSLLFEYTSPDNKIILDYQDASLTALGAMDLSASPPEFVPCPETIEDTYGTPSVKFYDLNGDTNEVIEQIRGWRNCEGIVAWCELPNGQMHLAKIKTSEYIRLHSLKYQFSPQKIRQFCWYQNITSAEQLQAELFHLGIDWEFARFIQPEFESYLAHYTSVQEQVAAFIQQMESEKIQELPNRREKAIRIKELTQEHPALFNIGIRYAMMGESEIQPFVDAMVLGVSVNAIKNRRKESEEMVSFLNNKNNSEEE